METGLKAEEGMVSDQIKPFLKACPAFLDEFWIKTARAGEERAGCVAGKRRKRTKLDGFGVGVQTLLEDLSECHELAVSPVHKDKTLFVFWECCLYN